MSGLRGGSQGGNRSLEDIEACQGGLYSQRNVRGEPPPGRAVPRCSRYSRGLGVCQDKQCARSTALDSAPACLSKGEMTVRANHRLETAGESGRQSFTVMLCLPEGFRTHASTPIAVLRISRRANRHQPATSSPALKDRWRAKKLVSAVDKTVATGGRSGRMEIPIALSGHCCASAVYQHCLLRVVRPFHSNVPHLL